MVEIHQLADDDIERIVVGKGELEVILNTDMDDGSYVYLTFEEVQETYLKMREQRTMENV